MSHRFYYVTSDPDILFEAKEYFAARRKVQREGVKFAKAFNGGAMFLNIRYELAGVAFDSKHQPTHPELWSRPDKHGMRRPKPGGGEAGAALRKKWKDNWPKAFADDHDLLLMLRGADVISNRIGMGIKRGQFFAMSRRPLKMKGGVEITASEYIAALGKDTA